jgi:hypothetical protein
MPVDVAEQLSPIGLRVSCGSLSAATLRDLGYDNARVVVGGLNAWKARAV